LGSGNAFRKKYFMPMNFAGGILGIVVVIVLAGLVALIAGFVFLRTKRECPHCRTMMPKNATTCAYCHKDLVAGA
jgi:amino acid permease